MSDLISVACARTGLSAKRLLGLAMRYDPLVVDLDASGQTLLVDDWRLERVASSLGDSAP